MPKRDGHLSRQSEDRAEKKGKKKKAVKPSPTYTPFYPAQSYTSTMLWQQLPQSDCFGRLQQGCKKHSNPPINIPPPANPLRIPALGPPHQNPLAIQPRNDTNTSFPIKRHTARRDNLRPHIDISQPLLSSPLNHVTRSHGITASTADISTTKRALLGKSRERG